MTGAKIVLKNYSEVENMKTGCIGNLLVLYNDNRFMTCILYTVWIQRFWGNLGKYICMMSNVLESILYCSSFIEPALLMNT